MCAASDSIRRPDFTAPKFKCGISWHFSAWMRAKTQEFGFNAVDTCWAIDIWNPFHPFSIHFSCRYFRTICAFSIFFTCFQWFSIIVTCCQKIQKCYCGRHDAVERQNASIMLRPRSPKCWRAGLSHASGAEWRPRPRLLGKKSHQRRQWSRSNADCVGM